MMSSSSELPNRQLRKEYKTSVVNDDGELPNRQLRK